MVEASEVVEMVLEVAVEETEELELDGVGHSPHPHFMDSYKISLKVCPAALVFSAAKV